MNQKINALQSLALGYPLQEIIEILIATALILLFAISTALAQDSTQALSLDEEQTQATVQFVAHPPEEPGVVAKASDSEFSQDSIDFLMGGSALPGNPSNASPIPVEPVKEEIPEPVPVPVSELQVPETRNSEEVAMLVSEQCSESGTAGEGTSPCQRIYSNGHRATVLTQNANEGDEIKSQTVIEEFDADGTLLFRKTLRHRVDYNYLNDQKGKEKEFFDIIYQPAGGKTTRELMVYEYYLDTGKTRSLSWTQYAQIGNEPKAGLVYHALLRFTPDGNPERGLAERWSAGKKAETFMDWRQGTQGFVTLDRESWKMWEGWIRSISLQAYLP